MTAYADQNNDSNNINSNEISDKKSSFKFKGFPYVISILGQNYTQECTDLQDKLKDCIDKIAEKCTWGIWYWKKSVIPLFILFDSNNDFIKKILEKKQEEYYKNNRKDRNLVLVAVGSNNYNKYENIKTYNDIDRNGQKPQRYWLSFTPNYDDQVEHSLQRQLNEFIVQHSHLAIIFNDKLETEVDINNAPDDNLIWAIRYKLEGYPGSQYQQKQTEKITYPAIGPVLRIVKDYQDNNIKTYFYPSREPITKQEGIKPEEFKPRELNTDYIISCEIENNKDFTEEPEIKNNLEILNRVNRKSLKFTDTDKKHNTYHIKDLALKDSKISAFDNPNSLVQRLIAYSITIQKISDNYQKWTTFVTHAFCLLFLFILACNSCLICINDVLITKLGVNLFQVWGWWNNPGNIQKDRFTILSIFLGIALGLLIFFIIICCVYSFFKQPHKKYHIFQTLADCLRIQAYWKFAGMDDNVSANFRSHQIPKTDWLMITLNGLNIITKDKEEEYSEDKIKLLDKFWLEDRIVNEFEPYYKTTPFKIVKDSLSKIDNIFIGLYALIFLYSLKCIIENIPTFYIIFLGIAIPIVGFIAWFLIKKGIHPQFITIVSLSLVLYGCLTGIFELWRLSALCDSAQSLDQKIYLTESFRLSVQLLASFILITILYLKMQMFDKERRRVEQLRSSFNVADYSLDVILNPNDKKLINQIASKKIEHDKEISNKTIKGIMQPESFLFNNEDFCSIFKKERLNSKIIDELLEKYNIHDKNEHDHDEHNQEHTKRTWSQWCYKLWNVFRGNDLVDTKTIVNDNTDKSDNLRIEIQNVLQETYKQQEEQRLELSKLAHNKRENFNKLKDRALDNEALNEDAKNNAKKELCQLILLELGQEVLAKRINWLLDVNDRDLKSPK